MPHKKSSINQAFSASAAGNFTGVKPVFNQLIFFEIYGIADSMSAVAEVLYITLLRLLTINRAAELEGSGRKKVSWV